MTKRSIYSVLLGALVLLVACNSNKEDEPTIDDSQDVQISSFALKADKKVMTNLDSVFFSIDLVNARIFNADSLPFGTKVDRLIPDISTSSLSAAELIVTRPGLTDTVYNYLKSPNDSIDFSNGPVKLRVVSKTGTYERTYTISVNVHRVKADSLEWGESAFAALPGNFTAPVSQRAVEYKDKFYSLVREDNSYYLVEQLSPAETDGQRIKLSLGFTPAVNSFSANDNGCYLLASDGTLYVTDNPVGQWQSTGLKWHAIVAAGSDYLVGSVFTDGQWKLQNYPDGSLRNIPDGFPVEGCSQTVSYSFPYSTSTNILMVGGRKADGAYSNACWSYDGTNWAKLSNKSLPEGLVAPTLIPYFTTRMSSVWQANTYSTLLIVGGLKADGTTNRTVYQSLDFGISWTASPQVMQLPAEVPAAYGAQAFVCDKTLHIPDRSRIIKPVTEWECPYIYVYGGYDASGSLYNSVWRAVINRYTFKPVE